MVKLWVADITDADINAVVDTLKIGYLARGPKVVAFEVELANLVGRRHAIAVSNGTTALHAAVIAAGLKRGDKVVTSPYSFIATTNALLMEGCVPIFTKVDSQWQMDLDDLEQVLRQNEDVVGIVIPHIFGITVNVDRFRAIVARYPHITVIEDAAQALAPKNYGLAVGSLGDLVTYSFHQNKVITTGGEGGAITTNSDALAERLQSLRSHGIPNGPLPSDWIAERIELGYNYRLTEVQAAMGRTQLLRLADILHKRESLAQYYREQLKAVPGIVVPGEGPRSWFEFYIECDSVGSAQKVVKALQDGGHEVRYMPFLPITNSHHVKQLDAAVTRSNQLGSLEANAKKVIMLPLHTELTFADIDKITEVISRVIA